MIRSEYKASKARLILLSVFLGLLIEGLAAIFLIVKEIRILVIIILIIVIPFFHTVYVIINLLVVRVTDLDVQFIRFGKPIESIPFENNEFEKCTDTNQFRLELSSSHQYLRVCNASGHVKDYSCCSLSKKDYENLMSEVIGLGEFYRRRKQEEAELASVVMAITGAAPTTDFYFPKEEFSTMEKKKLKFKLIITGSIPVALSILNPGVPMLFESDNKQAIIIQLWFMLSLFVFFGIAGFLFWLQYKTKVDSTPKYIGIMENELLIDDLKFSLPKIQMIAMISEQFSNHDKSLLREMKITVGGKKRRYFLGYVNKGKHNLQYEDYGRLCSSLNSFLKKNEESDVVENG